MSTCQLEPASRACPASWGAGSQVWGWTCCYWHMWPQPEPVEFRLSHARWCPRDSSERPRWGVARRLCGTGGGIRLGRGGGRQVGPGHRQRPACAVEDRYGWARVGTGVLAGEPGSVVARPLWESLTQLGRHFPLGQGRRPQPGHPGSWASSVATRELHPPTLAWLPHC